MLDFAGRFSPEGLQLKKFRSETTLWSTVWQVFVWASVGYGRVAGQELRGGEPVDFGVTCQIDPNWHPLGRWPGIALLKISLLVPVDCCVRPGSVPLGPDMAARTYLTHTYMLV